MSKLKKILIALPAGIITLFLLTGIAYGEEIKAGKINADSVNMRETPATTAKILAQLPKDANVTVIEKQDDWYKISYNDADGFVFAQFVTLKSTVIDSGTINASDVNVRSKPDTGSEILTRLDKGAKLEIYEYSGNWARISIAEGRSGWVCKEFVTVTKAEVSRGSESERPSEKPVEKSAESSAGKKDIRQEFVEYAKTFVGVRYRYGSSSPKGFDCSGFTSYVFDHFGINLERTSTDQSNHGTKIDRSDLKPGDLVFFDTNGGHNAVNHVGIYIGGGRMIHASSGSAHSVTISDITEGFYDNSYMRARRYIND